MTQQAPEFDQETSPKRGNKAGLWLVLACFLVILVLWFCQGCALLKKMAYVGGGAVAGTVVGSAAGPIGAVAGGAGGAVAGSEFYENSELRSGELVGHEAIIKWKEKIIYQDRPVVVRDWYVPTWLKIYLWFSGIWGVLKWFWPRYRQNMLIFLGGLVTGRWKTATKHLLIATGPKHSRKDSQ